METKEVRLIHLSPLPVWRAVFPSIQQSLWSLRLCAPCCARPSGEALNSRADVGHSSSSPESLSLMTWRHTGAMLRVQLRELREMGSWRRANDYFFEEVWESWSGSVEKTPEGGVLKECQVTRFYNILQLILKRKRLENNLCIQEKKAWGIVFPPWYWHPWPHHLCHQKTHQGSMAGPEPTPPTPPPGKNSDRQPFSPGTCWLMRWWLGPASFGSDRLSLSFSRIATFTNLLEFLNSQFPHRYNGSIKTCLTKFWGRNAED